MQAAMPWHCCHYRSLKIQKLCVGCQLLQTSALLNIQALISKVQNIPQAL